MIRIYIGSNVVLIATPSHDTAPYQPTKVINSNDIITTLQALKTADNEVVLVESTDIAATLKHIQMHYEHVIAAGGVVKNNQDEILLIHRRGYWDLPKGKLDEGEAIANCAIREVEEETGVQNLTLGTLIDCTYHIYDTYGSDAIKTTYWYAMETNDGNTLIPQAEEDITEAVWVPKHNLPAYYEHTYATIQDILKAYLAL